MSLGLGPPVERLIRIRVPFFSVVYFSRGVPSQPKKGKRKGTTGGPRKLWGPHLPPREKAVPSQGAARCARPRPAARGARCAPAAASARPGRPRWQPAAAPSAAAAPRARSPRSLRVKLRRGVNEKIIEAEGGDVPATSPRRKMRKNMVGAGSEVSPSRGKL